MKSTLTEDEIEQYQLQLLQNLGYAYHHGYDLQPEGKDQERENFGDVVLKDRLQQAIHRLNPTIPADALNQAQREIFNIASSDLLNNNEIFHKYLTEGITVEYQKNGETRGEPVNLIDWHNIDNNEFLVVNQFTVIEDNHNRRPDLVIFINGLPLVVIELKNAVDEKANLRAAYNQLQTYKREIPSLFTYNALLVISDGLSARAGSLTADFNRFSAWKVPSPSPSQREGDKSLEVPLPLGEGFRERANQGFTERAELEILTNGLLNKQTLLDLIRHFTVFEKTRSEDLNTGIVSITTIKKIAAYHQYYAVNKAIESIVKACGFPSPSPSQREGDKKNNLEVPRPLGEGFREREKLEIAKIPSPSPSQREGDKKNSLEVPRPLGEGFRERENQESRESIEDLGYKGGLAVTTLLEQVRELRKNQTSAEKVFWEIVRTKRFLGLKFRRQHQIGNYIVDFYCHDRKLVIELDGEIHNQPEQQQRDRQRTEYLNSLGLTVLRFTNQEIFQNLETVLQNLLDLLSPSPTGRGARGEMPRPPRDYWADVDVKSPSPTGRGARGEGSLSPSPTGRGARGEGNLSLQECTPRKGGVIWHTQGSGKSLSMVFLAGKLVLDPNLNNPTVVMLTDRNDLDDQLFDTFAGCQQLLRQDPQQADNRDRVRQLLNTNSGGIIFTTVQKFSPPDNDLPPSGGNQRGAYPKISDRANIIVLADEAHRSQYGFTAKQVDIKDENGNITGKATRYGFAKYIRDALPNACFVGFTGTPIEQSDKNTPAIFGDYIDIYDISQAVADGATVPIYYESRLVKVDLDEAGRQLLDELDEDLDSLLPLGEGLGEREQAKANQTRIEAIVGSTQRLQQIAQDIVTHFEARQQVNKGKAMIVTMTRRIAVNLYDAIVNLRPDWHSDDLTTGKIKVVFTASAADEENLVKHHTSKANRQTLAQRLKDPENSLELAIVCDMWLTGFDAPCLHTMYIDKPLKSHNLMQAIARINRVFHEKTGGLIVDYLGLAAELKKALAFYANSGGKGDLTLNQDVAVGLMLAKLEIVEQIMADFAYEHYFDSTTGEKLNILKNAANYVADPTIKDRFFSELNALSKAHSLAVPHPDAIAAAEKISFFQAIQASLRKLTGEGEGGNLSNHDIETAIRQVVDQALVSDAVINIFDEAGIKNPDISIISDEFMAEVRGMEHQNLAVELLQKLLKDEIKTSSRTNIVQSRKLSDLLDDALRRYRNQVISVTDILEELLNMAKDTKASQARGEELKLEPYELAFYDALAQNQSAQDVMGVDKLRDLAIVLCDRIRKNASIDWNLKESVRARMKVAVKRLLRQYGYPPDMEALATELVLEQAKVFTEFEVATNHSR